MVTEKTAFPISHAKAQGRLKRLLTYCRPLKKDLFPTSVGYTSLRFSPILDQYNLTETDLDLKPSPDIKALVSVFTQRRALSSTMVSVRTKSLVEALCINF